MIFLLMFLSSLWGILITEDLLHLPYNMKSNYLLVDLMIQLLKCPLCVSAHLFWISYLIMFGSMVGFLLCPIVYFLTYLIKKYIIKNEI